MVLNILRSKKFSRRVLLGILILIIPAFVLWGVGSLTDRPEPVGEIAGRKITDAAFSESRQGIKLQIILNYYGNYQLLNSIIRNRPLVNSMAWERLLLLAAAQKENINVDNREVTSYIANHPLFQRDGNFSQEAYSMILANPAVSMQPRQFEELIRENLIVKTLRDKILGKVDVTEEEIFEEYRRLNDKVKFSYILFDKEDFSEGVIVSREDVKNTYEANKDKFYSLPKADVEFIEIAYTSQEEKDEAFKKIESFYGKVKDDASKFIEAAEASGLKTGSTGPFTRNDVIPGVTFFQDFQNASFTLKEGQISMPLFSGEEEGIAYVIRKKSHVPPEPFTLEEVKGDIRMALEDIKKLEKAKIKAEESYQKISKEGYSFTEEASSSGKNVITTDEVGSEDYIENIGPASGVLLAAREAGEGSITPPLITRKGVLIIRVDEIIPADTSAYSDQKENIKARVLSGKQVSVMEEWFQENAPKSKVSKPLEEL